MGDVFDDVRAFVSQHALALQSASGDLRIAIVDYKDRGDVYVANKLDFVVYASVGEATGYLAGLTPAGGGDDYPESVHTGLKVAVEDLSWRPGATRTIVLIAGAPPQTIYDDEPDVDQISGLIQGLGANLLVIGTPTLNRIGERKLGKLVSALEGQFHRLGDKATKKKDDSGGRAHKGGIRETAAEKPTGSTNRVGDLMKSMGQPTSGGDAAAGQGTVDVARYPTIHAPDEVEPLEEFDVQVSLTEEQEVFEVEVKSGTTTDEAQLVLSLPEHMQSWTIQVVLSAPGFKIIGGNKAEIVLPREGDSSPALFTLSAKPFKKAIRKSKLFATLWYKGAYLAKIVRPILIVNPEAGPAAASAEAARTAASPATTRGSTPTRGPAALLDFTIKPPDLTVYVLESQNPSRPGETQIMINSPYLQITSTTFDRPEGLGDWLSSKYSKFVLAATTRGLKSERKKAMSPEVTKDRNMMLMKGFGRELYQKFTPPAFKDAFWRLKDKRGAEFKSIQIFSNNPVLPWELMRPGRDDGSGEVDFLGIEFRLARWHISQNATQLDRPPQAKTLETLTVIAPEYEGSSVLPNQVKELAVLEGVRGYKRLPGEYWAIKKLFAAAPGGIIHFAGHGVVGDSEQGTHEYSIQLEDAEMDLMTWRGMTAGQNPNHPFVFFNACEIGQSHSVANFVDGWAPAVLEAGSSGYIGGMWPLGDLGAAEFSTKFYGMLEEQLGHGPVPVAEILRVARQQFYETGDPTHLAYVYYGDPNFQFAKK